MVLGNMQRGGMRGRGAGRGSRGGNSDDENYVLHVDGRRGSRGDRFDLLTILAQKVVLE